MKSDERICGIKTVEELRRPGARAGEQLFALRLQKVTGQLEKPAKVRTARKDLARVLTVLREKRRPALERRRTGRRK